MNIDINLLKQLRELTNAPLKDCKEVLVEANGDLTQAQELLKQKGAIKAVSKADREIKEELSKSNLSVAKLSESDLDVRQILLLKMINLSVSLNRWWKGSPKKMTSLV